MRSPRIKLTGQPAVYHCISRIVGGQFLLNDLEKEHLRLLLWLLADFCGVQIITYCLMSNHFHVLVRILSTEPPSDEELLRRARRFYGQKSFQVRRLEAEIEQHGAISDKQRRRLVRRMNDLSIFMKELKQGFSVWFNRKYGRFGTLWAERFKSVLIEDEPSSVQKVAAYIDLNAIRAGLVSDPKDYRFCGYAQALGEGGLAQEGLASCLPGESWSEKMEHYRKYLFCESAVAGHSDKQTLSKEELQAKLSAGETLTVSEVLRMKVRYLTAGAVLGSQAFVEEVFGLFRAHFGKGRKDGARAMKGADWGGMMVLRALRKNLFG